MEDIPQPADIPYSPGDRVRVYISPDDVDAQFHGVEVEVTNVHQDSLDADTGRLLNKYSYTVRSVDSGDVLPIQFRHRDLVPSSELD